MATPNPEGEFDWTAAEADVVHLGDARRNRRPESWSADIDDEHDKVGDQPIPVDPPPTPPAVTRLPIVPAWLRSKTEALAFVRWFAGHYAHISTYHLLRLPLYLCRLVFRSLRGVLRTVAATARWSSDAEGRPVRLAAVRREDAEDYLRLSRQRDGRVRLRTLILTLVLGAGASAGTTLLLLTPRWAWYCGLVAIIGLLGVIGSSPDKPLMDVAAIKPRVRKLTADVLMRAFLAAGLCKVDEPITFPMPIMRDGPGWRAVIDLPYGTKADTAIKKRNDLAAGLDLDEVQVWPERVRGTTGSARRLALWVADEDPYAKASALWPLIVKGSVDVFEPFPFGEDQRGRPVRLLLMFTSLLIGAIPRMGKTFAARVPALACALDPIVELHIYDGKGGQDWRVFERVAHRIGFGVRDEVVLALVEDLRALVADMNRRYDTIATLPADICPESKATRAIAERRSLKLWPILVLIDEFQRYSGHPVHGAEIVELLTELCKVGPSVGIMIELATQKPDGKAVPTDLRDNMGTRFALKTMTWQSSEAVLGAGSYTAGHDASRFQRAHKGVGILLGADDSGAVEDAVTVRTNRTPLPTSTPSSHGHAPCAKHAERLPGTPPASCPMPSTLPPRSSTTSSPSSGSTNPRSGRRRWPPGSPSCGPMSTADGNRSRSRRRSGPTASRSVGRCGQRIPRLATRPTARASIATISPPPWLSVTGDGERLRASQPLGLAPNTARSSGTASGTNQLSPVR